MIPFALDHPAVQGYLRRLDLATAHLPADERVDILEGIRSHLLTVMAEAETEADVHRALDALGSPEEIVGTPAPAPAPPRFQMPQLPPPGSARGALEIVAVIFLLAGAFIIPVIGWVVGVVLLWVSKAWTTREKWLGTLVLPGGLGAAALLAFASPFAIGFAAPSCSSGVAMTGRGRAVQVQELCTSGFPMIVLIFIGLFVLIAPVVTAIYLLRAAGRRPAPAPADIPRPMDAPRSSGELLGTPPPASTFGQESAGSARGALEIVAVIFLLTGAFIIPFVGWIVGVVLLWVSRAWTTREKWLGTLVLPGGLAASVALVFLGPPLMFRWIPGWLVMMFALGVGLAPVFTAVHLLKTAGGRTAPTDNG